MATDSSTQAEAVIIGAGPAGLAVGACLQRAGIPFVILEEAARVGESWHHHYERLHLHTAKRFSQLPFFAYPKSYPTYPSRAQVIEYLEAYARHFNLQPRFGQKALSVQRTAGMWQTRTADATFLSPYLIVATGNNRVPFLPHWPGEEAFPGAILHSAAYRNGQPFVGQRVLVVGLGNSGGEIAVDLVEAGAQVAIAVRNPVNILPRELLGIPIQALAIALNRLPPRLADFLVVPIFRLLFGDLVGRGLKRLPYGPFVQIKRLARIPMIDVGTVRLMRAGQLQIYPEPLRFEGGEIVFADQRRQTSDAVILATGYRSDLSAIVEGVSLDNQGVAQWQGEAPALSGLYFCGFHTTPAGVLREIALEAKRIAQEIANDLAKARGVG